MKKGLLLLTSLFLLAGCALPLPLKVASWALDGVSYLATNKSIAENGLSIIAQKDCSLMRPLQGQPVCIGNNYDIAQVLKNAVASASVDDQGVQAQEAMAEFETAAGPAPDKLSYDASEFSDAWRFMRQQAAQTEQTAQTAQMEPEHIAKALSRVPMKAAKAVTPPGYDAGENAEAWAFIQARNGGLAAKSQAGPDEETQQAADTTEPIPPIIPPMAQTPETGPDTQPSAGLYYVIGSLTRLIDIDRLSQRQNYLESLVVVAQVRDRPIYREVVGPFKRSEKQAVRRMIEKAGVTKAWLTFIDPHRWTLASPAEISAMPCGGAQTASLR
ncbi:MAG TPA: hypothetical protein ENI55_05495 [Alphaproteobacteria bacterium]|nr:hypothetical protein [Alphaproteobacteria bacterium]